MIICLYMSDLGYFEKLFPSRKYQRYIISGSVVTKMFVVFALRRVSEFYDVLRLSWEPACGLLMTSLCGNERNRFRRTMGSDD